jgi:hypothetical protein
MLKRTLYFLIHNLAVFVANKTIDPKLSPGLPAIFDRLDYEMPFVLRAGTEASMANLVADLITKETGIKEAGLLVKLVSQVCELYDPRKGVKG